MNYRMVFSPEARDDLEMIVEYISENDSLDAAEYVFESIVLKAQSLQGNPHRGSFVPELACLSVRTYRQLHFKPYRIVYRVEDEVAYIYGIFDGRRDLQDLLERRLLR